MKIHSVNWALPIRKANHNEPSPLQCGGASRGNFCKVFLALQRNNRRRKIDKMDRVGCLLQRFGQFSFKSLIIFLRTFTNNDWKNGLQYFPKPFGFDRTGGMDYSCTVTRFIPCSATIEEPTKRVLATRADLKKRVERGRGINMNFNR